LPFPSGNRGLLAYKDQYVFHPVRYVEGLAKAASDMGAVIYCNSKAIKLKNGEIKTVSFEDGITVEAKHVVMATQYPFYDGANLFYTRLYPKRAYGRLCAQKRIGLTAVLSMSEIPLGQSERMLKTASGYLIVVGENHDTGRGYGDMSLHFENDAICR
jgi:glycine/D-amino acid oxidase-like deaminating enzyme